MAEQQAVNTQPLLLPEALGFSPQLLLDDIINIANNAVTDAVNGLEEFLQRWADERAKKDGVGEPANESEWDPTGEVEQGLVAFQTLLEYHTDIAFDFFEAWSLRNVFAVPPDLPIVLPHQEGLDLTQSPEREKELMDEIAELRLQLQDQRRLGRVLTRAVHVSRAGRRRAEKRRERLSFLHDPTFDTIEGLPQKLFELYKSVSALPEIDPATLSSLTQYRLSDPGKRPWETSKTGYLNWAVSQLLVRARERNAAEGRRNGLDEDNERVQEVGSADQLKAAIEAMDRVQASLEMTTDLS
ncbi:hypothetical protein EYR40_010264 [Pleurotus pulmonarius]|nr:hypothetical protein EYR36_010343 [Pleurotus pulmonarius]KAF4588710.1 hypothetical protein EYR40_010264 [Pleurotus pulmonarius]